MIQCYIRCYLTEVGILNEDKVDKEKAIEMNWAVSDDTLDDCIKEGNGNMTEIDAINNEMSQSLYRFLSIFHGLARSNPCEVAYFTTRCVMMRNILDTRTSN